MMGYGHVPGLRPPGTALAAGFGAPQLLAPQARVKVTEADKLAWMRQFLGALEQWKTCLDTLFAAEDDVDRQVDGVDVLTGKPVAAPPPPPKPEQAAEELAAIAATQQAHAAQYIQLQLWQQTLDGGAAAASSTGLPSSRFKDEHRPMRMCKHFATTGFCRQGEGCTFAHLVMELHPSSPDLRPHRESDEQGEQEKGNTGGPTPENSELDLRLKKKKERCQRFDLGNCKLGSVCPFAHGADEMNTVGLAVFGKVKMQLCRNWENGRCVNNEFCMNAHGDHEIGTKRPPPELERKSAKVRRFGELDGEADAEGALGSG